MTRSFCSTCGLLPTLIVVVGAVLLSPAQASPTYQTTDLGMTWALGLSSTGQVLESPFITYWWQAGAGALLYSSYGSQSGSQTPLPFTYATAISSNGIVGGLAPFDHGSVYAATYNANTPDTPPKVSLAPIPGTAGVLPYGWPAMSATAVNDSGLVAGTGYTVSPDFKSPPDYPYGPQHAVVSDGTTITDLGTLGGGASAPTGINHSSEVVGNSTLANGDTHAFLYANGKMTDLGVLPGLSYSTATGINDSGQVVGYSQTPIGAIDVRQGAFLFENGRMTDLGTVAGDTSARADAINSQGTIVGESGGATGPGEAFIRLNGVMTDLNSLIPSSADFHLVEARYINDAGQIVAEGRDARGVLNEYLLTPSGMPTPVDPILSGSEVPEPSTLTFAFLVGSVLAAQRVCRRTRCSAATTSKSGQVGRHRGPSWHSS